MTSGARQAGYTLVEVLVALVVSGVVLSACFGWVWSIGALARVHDDRAQAATIAAAAERAIVAEVRAAVGVAPSSRPGDPAHSLALVHDHRGAAREEVAIVWDPSRRVVWRNASGTYLADHVTGFEVTYALSDGRTAGAGTMASADWSRVSGVRVRLSAGVGSAVVVREIRAEVGP